MDDSKKRLEKEFVTTTARLLGENWSIQPRERPDFIITTDSGKFALEVTQVFIGETTNRGSEERIAENSNNDWLESIRKEFERQTDVALNLKYLGSSSVSARTQVLSVLIEERFDDKPVLHRLESRLTDGSVFARKAIQPYWTFVKDTVGWVSRDAQYVEDAIERKATKLDGYREASADVRLLVVADRRYNSGKLIVEDGFNPDLAGFDAIYFLSYPTNVRVYGRD